jgi:hypothetical protein
MRLGAFENERPYGLRGVGLRVVPELAESRAAADRHAAANTRSVVGMASVMVVPHAAASMRRCVYGDCGRDVTIS